MTKVNVSRKVKCSADEAYAIIRDVENYKDFLPFVKDSKMSKPAKAAPGVERATAALRVRYKKIALDESFTSQVEFDKASRTITMKSSDGPLRHLDATWTIAPAGARACELTLVSDLSLKSSTLQFFLAGMIDYIVRRLFSSFEARALELQGAETA